MRWLLSALKIFFRHSILWISSPLKTLGSWWAFPPSSVSADMLARDVLKKRHLRALLSHFRQTLYTWSIASLALESVNNLFVLCLPKLFLLFFLLWTTFFKVDKELFKSGWKWSTFHGYNTTCVPIDRTSGTWSLSITDPGVASKVTPFFWEQGKIIFALLANRTAYRTIFNTTEQKRGNMTINLIDFDA